MAKIHSTAVVDPKAELADDVEVGPFCVIEPEVKIGRGTCLRAHVVIRRYTTIGRGNIIDPFTVLGGDPQDYKFDSAQVSYLRIGDENIFRECVTISRATGAGKSTIVGNKTMWMAYSHAGHNAVVEDEAILVNGAAVGGHAVLGQKAILSGHVMVHQYTWIGRMVMTQGNSGFSAHVPPYTLTAKINCVVGLNSVGLRRAPDLADEDRRQIKTAFSLTYRSGLSPAKALEKMDECTDWGEAAAAFRDFIRRVVTAEEPYNRGLCPLRRKAGWDWRC
ncbi:MAG: acyl-ACP--UDP-N-acetylglucosamine O-acyltransferase [Phycisphaerae bacterium]|nr:acyl-ACP--UDP-N-acetylglucosamine O-acyltransferase [Phycisphaerae bacterium]